jgi:hypothetical protein
VIADAKVGQVLSLKRGRCRWTERTLDPTHACETMLAGFRLACPDVFEAAAEEQPE